MPKTFQTLGKKFINIYVGDIIYIIDFKYSCRKTDPLHSRSNHIKSNNFVFIFLTNNCRELFICTKEIRSDLPCKYYYVRFGMFEYQLPSAKMIVDTVLEAKQCLVF